MKKLIEIFEQELIPKRKFIPFEPIDNFELIEILSKLDFKFPQELIEIWRKFGGGDLFETETILSPIHPIKSENMLYYNEFDNQNTDIYIFQTGFFDAGVDIFGRIWIIESSGNRIKLKNMFEWYQILKKIYE